MKKVSLLILLCFPCFLLAELSIEETDTHIEITNDGGTVLVYHKAHMPPPDGQPKYFERNGFIHPINAPSGGAVTGIHPADHIHHMGLWHAWVETYHNGRNLDFWNLKEETATIRYVKTLKIFNNDKRVGFTVRQHHVALAKDGHPEKSSWRKTSVSWLGRHRAYIASITKQYKPMLVTTPLNCLLTVMVDRLLTVLPIIGIKPIVII